jgi:hypothetical protein
LRHEEGRAARGHQEDAMNKGDFIGACLPGTLLRSGTDRYTVLSDYDASHGISGSVVGFTIPAALLSQLQAEGLVQQDRVLLYGPSTRPNDSKQNMDRYLEVLRQLGPVAVTD